jgi:hypothetical protein
MTLYIGPPQWQQGWGGGGGEVGSFYNSLADVVGAPAMFANPFGGYPMARAPMPMPPQYAPNPYAHGIPSQRIVPSIPGVPALGVKLQPLGFSDVQFNATSGTSLTATTRPQKPFKGRRLVVELARTGATATGLVKITSITIGVNNQFVSTGSVSAGAFAANGFDVNVELSACSTALDINVNYTISAAPAMTDKVDVGTTMFGETVGS